MMAVKKIAAGDQPMKTIGKSWSAARRRHRAVEAFRRGHPACRVIGRGMNGGRPVILIDDGLRGRWPRSEAEAATLPRSGVAMARVRHLKFVNLWSIRGTDPDRTASQRLIGRTAGRWPGGFLASWQNPEGFDWYEGADSSNPPGQGRAGAKISVESE